MDTKTLKDIIATRIQAENGNPTGISFLYSIVQMVNELEELKLENSSGLKEYDEMILRSIKKIKNKWKPATLHGVPIKFLFRMPLSFSTKTI